MNGLVVIEHGSPVTNSLVIAEKFNKPHADVAKAIRKTISQIPVDFSSSSFFEGKFMNSRGREYDCFKMNRDAYSLIVMGFTGKAALDWKIKFILDCDSHSAFSRSIQLCNCQTVKAGNF